MAMRIKLRFEATCPRHRRYDPARDGPGAIRGGCPACRQLWRIELARRQLQTAIEGMLELLQAHQDPWIAGAILKNSHRPAGPEGEGPCSNIRSS